MRRLLRKPVAAVFALGILTFGAGSGAAAQPQVPPGASGVSGVVMDADSNRPVDNATISSGGARVITGPGGRFRLTAPAGVVVLKVAAPGYIDVVTSAEASVGGPDVELVIVRQPSIANHVDVRGTTTDPAPAVRRVEPAEVLRTPGALDNIFRALHTLPGVVATPEATGFMSVRGGSPDQNLTLLDGVEVHDPYRLYGLASAFNPDTIQRFDLATGGFSVRYGDRLSSLLAVESRDGASGRPLSGQAAMSVTDANIVMEGAIPRVNGGSWLMSARRTYYDVIADLVSRSAVSRVHGCPGQGDVGAARRTQTDGLRIEQPPGRRSFHRC